MPDARRTRRAHTDKTRIPSSAACGRLISNFKPPARDHAAPRRARARAMPCYQCVLVFDSSMAVEHRAHVAAAFSEFVNAWALCPGAPSPVEVSVIAASPSDPSGPQLLCRRERVESVALDATIRALGAVDEALGQLPRVACSDFSLPAALALVEAVLTEADHGDREGLAATAPARHSCFITSAAKETGPETGGSDTVHVCLCLQECSRALQQLEETHDVVVGERALARWLQSLLAVAQAPVRHRPRSAGAPRASGHGPR